jgi:hypothetical protein
MERLKKGIQTPFPLKKKTCKEGQGLQKTLRKGKAFLLHGAFLRGNQGLERN